MGTITAAQPVTGESAGPSGVVGVRGLRLGFWVETAGLQRALPGFWWRCFGRTGLSERGAA
jgi:hypothetical protein